MIKLEQLHGDKGARQKRKRVGRGESSGQGKTAGKGNKGAQARTGTPKGKSFEGGQTPLTRRLPKRGFSRTRWQIPHRIVNLEQLNRFEDGALVDFNALVEAHLVHLKAPRVKILGTGELKKKNLTVVADAFSKAAREKIEASGGKCQASDLQDVAAQPAPVEVPTAAASEPETVPQAEKKAPGKKQEKKAVKKKTKADETE